MTIGNALLVLSLVYWPFFEKRGGLVPVIVQDARTKEVLMLAYTDAAGLLETLLNGLACFFSTSRNERWLKGETSGNTQRVIQILIDCDGDALIYLVEPQGEGAACHTGARSCFFRSVVGCVDLENIKVGDKEKLLTMEVKVDSRLVR